jgi:hypothetical protein
MAEDPIESAGLVDQDRIQVTPDDTLVLPLAQSSSRRADITFTVRRAVPRELARIRLPLPVPAADAVGTGELAVTGAADVELLPDLAASDGLMPMPVTEASETARPRDRPRHLFRTTLPEAVFVAERISRGREVSVSADAQIELLPAAAVIDQRFDYAVRYEAIKELNFRVPAEMSWDLDEVQATLLGTAARGDANRDAEETPLSIAATDTEGISPGARQLRIVLPQPRLGQFAVRIHHSLQASESDWTGGLLQVPLFQPVDGRIKTQTASIHTPRALAVSLDATRGGSWKSASSSLVEPGLSFQFIAETTEPLLPLLVQLVDPNLPSSTIVERVWLQSWLSGEVRQDRAAFRIRTTAPQTAIELPPQVPSDEVEVLVDSSPAELVSRAPGRITVQLPEAAEDSVGKVESNPLLHTIELRYRQAARPGLIRRHRLTPPQIVGTTALSEVYWQIVLPGDQHIVKSPTRMTQSSQWQWLSTFWGRSPALSQADLEAWSGASTQLAPVSTDNASLFTGLAPVGTIEVVSAPRWLIVLAASSAVLTAVLLWTYVPRTQRGWLLVAVAIVIAGLAIAYPGPALLLAQAAVLGVVLAAISVFVGRVSARRSRWPVTLSTGSSQRQLTPRADSLYLPPVAAAASTAPTASLGIPDSNR